MELRSALASVCESPMTWPKRRRRAFLIGLPVTLPLWLVAAAISLALLLIASVVVLVTSLAQTAWGDIVGG